MTRTLSLSLHLNGWERERERERERLAAIRNGLQGKLLNSLSLPINALLSNKYNLFSLSVRVGGWVPDRRRAQFHSVSFLFSSSPVLPCTFGWLMVARLLNSAQHTQNNLNIGHWWRTVKFSLFPSVSLLDRPVWPEKKLPKAYKSCPKMISLEKLKILTRLLKLPKNVGDLG